MAWASRLDDHGPVFYHRTYPSKDGQHQGRWVGSKEGPNAKWRARLRCISTGGFIV